jgi:hypothetical protein
MAGFCPHDRIVRRETLGIPNARRLHAGHFSFASEDAAARLARRHSRDVRPVRTVPVER